MKLNSYTSSLKSRTMRCLALCLAMAWPAAIRSHAQCYIDPATGQRVCAPPSEALSAGGAPALDSRPSALDSSAHCRVTVADGNTGSGALVDVNDRLGLVLTCSHLFDGAGGRIIVAFPNGQRFAARLIERDTAHDLAALLIRRPDVAPLEVCDDEPAGMLTACGFGPDGYFRAIHGAIAGHATAAGATHPSQTITGAVRPGDSGGAVLNARGQLVGVVWGQRDGLTYATCGRPVREFLARVMGRGSRAESRESRAESQPSPPALDSRLLALDSRIAELDALMRALKETKIDGVSFGKLIAGALGLSGPLAAAVIVAGALVGRRTRRAPLRVAAKRTGQKSLAARRSASGAERILPDTRYVPVERDSFAKAHQWASEQVARKYPGAAEVLQAQESLIKQYLAAQ